MYTHKLIGFAVCEVEAKVDDVLVLSVLKCLFLVIRTYKTGCLLIACVRIPYVRSGYCGQVPNYDSCIGHS